MATFMNSHSGTPRDRGIALTLIFVNRRGMKPPPRFICSFVCSYRVPGLRQQGSILKERGMLASIIYIPDIFLCEFAFFTEYRSLLFRPRIVSLACTPRCKYGSRPGSVARALDDQSREIWHISTG